jgi:hypothetical protein
MNTDEMNKLNRSASILSELYEFLHDNHLTLRDFRLRMVQQQVDQANRSNPTKLFQITHHAGGASHAQTNHRRRRRHSHHRHNRRHYYDDPAVAAAMETVGIGDCEALFTTVFNYHGKKTGTMPSLSATVGRFDWSHPTFPGLNTVNMAESPQRSHHAFPEQKEIAIEQRPRTSPALYQSSSRHNPVNNRSSRLIKGPKS